MTKKLSDKAMLISLEVNTWRALRKDEKISAEVAEKYDADRAMGSYTKRLAPPEALAAIRQLKSEIKRFHKTQTLPWDDRFNRVLLAKNFTKYAERMREFRGRFEKLADDFEIGYPAIMAEAKTRLNGLFNAEDYPHPEDIRGFFVFKTDVSAFPDAGDFRVNLRAEEVNAIQAEMQNRFDNAVKTAMADAWGRLYEQVQRMAERLTGEEPIRHDYVADLEQLLDLLPMLNLTNDAQLNKMAKDAKLKLTAAPTSALRENQGLRDKTANDADAIMQAMSAYMGA